jgi:hypothetical protein
MAFAQRDLLPMFTVTDAVDGALVRYQDIWQRRNLVLVMVPENDPTGAEYTKPLIEAACALAANDTTLVVTSNTIPGIPSPGVVVADRWGEIYYVKSAGRAADLPTPTDLDQWVRYVQSECPECQGEAR